MHKLLSDKGLGTSVAPVVTDSDEAAEQAFVAMTQGGLPGDPRAAFAIERSDLEFAATAAFESTELASFADHKQRENRLDRTLAPPVALRWNRGPQGLLIEWDGSPRNDAVAREVAGNPLLTTGYRIYRWRADQEPAAVGKVPLDQTSFLDAEVGLQGGRVFYSVVTVLEGMIGNRDSLIESERSDVLTVDLEDRFQLRVLSGDATQATIEVTTDGPIGPRSMAFPVKPGSVIGALVSVDGMPADFQTGLTVTAIELVPATREERVRHPVFAPDGSRARDESGFVHRDDVRTVSFQRIVVRCVDARGSTRTLTLDPS
ncbi:MAG: hypothetical protein IPH13_21570 [Planctomycetes bacterium]|nr:hypothetical protein [Planctomycetota bacterium]